jgi:hypothetical protein
MTLLLLLSITSIVTAQDGASANLPKGIDNKTPSKDEPVADAPSKPAAEVPAAAAPDKKEEPAKDSGDSNPNEEQFLKNGKPVVKIESINPISGPYYGDTKVVVRGGPFAPFQQEHPEPRCKFGDQVVSGTYVNCPPHQPKVYEKEGSHVGRTALCV